MKAPDSPAMPAEYRYENTLKWIRLLTGMHYFGGAFDPEHMRVLANIVADSLAGKDLPDFDDTQARAASRARIMADRIGKMLYPGDPEDEDEDDNG